MPFSINCTVFFGSIFVRAIFNQLILRIFHLFHREISILQAYTAKAGSPKVNLPFLYPPTPPTLKSDFQKKLRVAGCVLLQTKTTNTDIHPHPKTIYPTSPDYSEKPVYSLGLRLRYLLPDKGFHILYKSWRTPFY